MLGTTSLRQLMSHFATCEGTAEKLTVYTYPGVQKLSFSLNSFLLFNILLAINLDSILV